MDVAEEHKHNLKRSDLVAVQVQSLKQLKMVQTLERP